MKGLFAVFKMRFGLILNYRMAAIAGVFTQLFFGFVMVMIYSAFFESQSGLNNSTQMSTQALPMTLNQTVTYIWLGQGLLGLLPWNGDREIQGMIRNGDFAYELVRPLDMYNYWFYRILAQRIAGTFTRCAPLFLMALFLMPSSLRLSGPIGMSGFLMFLLTLSTGVLLGAAISNVITISVLFTIGDGIERLLPAIVTIFSGMVIPLSFFPDWSLLALKLLPFSGLVDGPYRFYLGLYDIRDLVFVLSHQVLWSMIIIGFGRWMLQKASSRMIVQGG